MGTMSADAVYVENIGQRAIVQPIGCCFFHDIKADVSAVARLKCRVSLLRHLGQQADLEHTDQLWPCHVLSSSA